MNVFYAINALAAMFGFCLSAYITYSKHAQKPLVCPLQGECDAVVQSAYSRFLGIPLEYLGMSYYGCATFAYLYLSMTPVPPSVEFVFVTYVLTALAFFFSVYLTFLQAFTLRQWCTWCLTSAGVSALIFFIVAYSSTFNWVGFVDLYIHPLQFIATLGMILGVGGTTIADILFFVFLKDLKISSDESTVLKTIGQVTWVGLALLVLASFALYATHPTLLLMSAAHKASVLLLLVILVNAVFLHLMVTPQLVHISFGGEHDHTSGELRFLRQFSFALLTVSIISWYTLFVVYFLGDTLPSLSSIVASYGVLLLLGLGLMQHVERRLVAVKVGMISSGEKFTFPKSAEE